MIDRLFMFSFFARIVVLIIIGNSQSFSGNMGSMSNTKGFQLVLFDLQKMA